VNTPLTLQSVNGPDFTMINGGGTNQCLYLTNDAVMVGFTLTNGVADYGGGVYCASTSAVLTNCVLTGNSASDTSGGAYGGTLNNCTLTGNSANGGSGGGASYCTLNNCTLAGNSANGGGGVTAGGGAVYCTLNNCTLTGNSAPNGAGGGAYDCTLNNCTLTGNTGAWGGGASFGTLNNCTLTGNSAWYGSSFVPGGGGAYFGTLNNCTLIGNSALYGGGACGGTLNNCIVYYNVGPNYSNYYYGWVFDFSTVYSYINYCCTTPMPTNGVGNITNAPLFVNYAGSNLRLQSDSPCINSGNNAYVVGSTDLDGNPRIVGGTVDIGAYEYQTPLSMISYAWLQQYGLPTDGSADYADPDHDGLNDWQEWICGTIPTNAVSVLRMLSAIPTPTNATVTWQSMAGVNYFLERSADLAAPFTLLATNIVGQASTTAYADTNATGAGPFFYRVGVNRP
jgi:hypothetical protein